MKNKTKIVATISFLLIFNLSVLYSHQKAEWKGKVVIEEGVRVIQNPAHSLYGKIHFRLEEDLSIGSEEDENYMFYLVWHIAVDKKGNIYVVDWGKKHVQMFDDRGQYIRTIGRQGQGPGEFGSPDGVFVIDINREIYVPDGFSIEVFSATGDYKRTIILKTYNRSYCISPGGVIIGETDKHIFKDDDKNQTSKILATLRFINSADGSESTIASFPDQRSKNIEGRVAKFTHGYEHEFHLGAVDPQTFVYGFSSDYLLNIIDSTGKILFKIQKESTPLPISKEEKDTVKEKYRDSPIKNLNNIPFPKHKPYFGRILTDGDKIFVMHYRSPQDQSKAWPIDIFDNRGYYLYEGMFPVQPKIIKNGFVYLIESSDETGNIRVKRYKIINWEQLKGE